MARNLRKRGKDKWKEFAHSTAKVFPIFPMFAKMGKMGKTLAVECANSFHLSFPLFLRFLAMETSHGEEPVPHSDQPSNRGNPSGGFQILKLGAAAIHQDIEHHHSVRIRAQTENRRSWRAAQ